MDRAEAVVDLAAIRHNVTMLRAKAHGRTFMAVVKADGYGHGVLPVARAARDAGADVLGVALPEEAQALRTGGDTGTIMCWLYTPNADLTECVRLGVELSAAMPGTVTQVAEAARRAGAVADLHLKVDTGLGRSGAPMEVWPDLVRAALVAERSGQVRIVGVWSHLATADEPESEATDRQLGAFEQAIAVARHLGVEAPTRHIAASGGVLAHPDSLLDLVRCGISVYGLSPGRALGSAADLGLRPAMTVRARVALVKDVPAGQGVSYGLRYRTSRRTRLALVPVGYADGLPRSGSGRLPLSVAGRTFPVAGTIAMDQVVLDVGDLDVAAGDVVELFGTGADGRPTADDWAEACGTINYEIVTRLGPRIPRRHVDGGV